MQFLVAASPRNEVSDTHWFRADFDQHLLWQAQRSGAAYFDKIELNDFREEGDEIFLTGEREAQKVEFRAGFEVGATGPRGCVFNLLGLAERELPLMPGTCGLFAHFRKVPSPPSTIPIFG